MYLGSCTFVFQGCVFSTCTNTPLNVKCTCRDILSPGITGISVRSECRLWASEQCLVLCFLPLAWSWSSHMKLRCASWRLRAQTEALPGHEDIEARVFMILGS